MNSTRSKVIAAIAAWVVVGALGLAGVAPAGAAASDNDDFADAATISGTSGTWYGSNDEATCEDDEPDHADNICDASIWFEYKPAQRGLLVIDTNGSAFDTVLAVYKGSSLSTLEYTEAASDDDSGTGLASLVGPFLVSSSTTYRIAVDDVDDPGSVRLHWQLYPYPDLVVGNASVVEGRWGGRYLRFTLALNETSGLPVRVQYHTVSGSAKTSDYYPRSGAATIPAGATSTEVVVSVKGDTRNESNETLRLDLSGATNADLVDNRGSGTIRDDDPGSSSRPEVSIGDASLREGDKGKRYLRFAVTLSRTTDHDVRVRYTTVPGSARWDYVSKTARVTIPAGSTSAKAYVEIKGDTTNESNEAFKVSLVAVTGATIARSTGTGTIADDD